MSKLRFKKEYEDAVISIPGKRLTITKYNIESDEVQAVIKKFPKYAHNFEVVEDEDGNKTLQPSSMLEGGEGEVDLLQDAPVVEEKPAPKKSASKKSTSKKGSGKKK